MRGIIFSKVRANFLPDFPNLEIKEKHARKIRANSVGNSASGEGGAGFLEQGNLSIHYYLENFNRGLGQNR